MVTSRKPSKRPSMFEVAKLAGVSHQTVSRVINDSPDVSDATRARVQAAIDQLGYRPSNSARALASRRSRTIGLIAGGLKFFGPISSISSIESMAREHGLFMSVMMVHEALCAQADFDNLCDTFNEQNVDAFIFLTPTDVMFAAACRARVTQPRVIVTATHGQMTVREGLGLISTENKRRTALVGIDQWVCIGFGAASSSVLVWQTFALNARYGEHGLMKLGAARSHPRYLINRRRITRLLKRQRKEETT